MDHWAYQVLFEYHWAFGPLLYCYVRSFLDPAFRIKQRLWLIFLAPAIQVLFSFWVKIQNLYWTGSPDDLPFLGSESYQLWMHTPFQYLVLSIILLIFTIQAINLIDEAGDRALNSAQKSSLHWLRMIIRAYQLFTILVILLTSLDYFFFDYAFEPFYPFPVFIALAGLTYWLALSGYSNREATLPPPPIPHDISQQDQEWLKVMDQIEAFMQTNQPYLNQDLSLPKLAEYLELKNYQITQALNRIRKQTFSQYINGYRVKEAQRLLSSPDHGHLTVLALGFDSGFNSKASFNRVFKANTGLSPSEYKRQVSSSNK